MRRWARLIGWALVVATAGCGGAPPSGVIPMNWTPVDSLNAHRGVRVFAGRNDQLPLRAWYVEVDAPEVRVDAVVSDDSDRRETASSFSRDLGACVVMNGGYFRMDLDPAEHVSLLVADDSLHQPALSGVLRDDARYPTTRAAIGFSHDGHPEIEWVATIGGQTLVWDRPWPNSPGVPAETPSPESGRPWTIRSGIAAGPLILQDGRMDITGDEEVFFGTSIGRVHPRSAAGITASGDLILMVVDGRQPYSRGVTLEELAGLMADAGAVEALNLDGGGSSTLIVDGHLVNLPSGAAVQREIMSALAVYCSP